MKLINIIAIVSILALSSCGAEESAQDTVSQTSDGLPETYRHGTTAGAITSAVSDALTQ